jgi:hypothetical protein
MLVAWRDSGMEKRMTRQLIREIMTGSPITVQPGTRIDACFPRSEEFVFRAGNHHEVVRMRYEDYERLVRPVVGEFCLHAREKQVNE